MRSAATKATLEGTGKHEGLLFPPSRATLRDWRCLPTPQRVREEAEAGEGAVPPAQGSRLPAPPGPSRRAPSPCLPGRPATRREARDFTPDEATGSAGSWGRRRGGGGHSLLPGAQARERGRQW